MIWQSLVLWVVVGELNQVEIVFVNQQNMKVGGSRLLGRSTPFLSIITVVFNGEKLIENTILSVSEQSSQDYEYLIIDGGSKDSTTKILQKYDSKINYWQSEPDQGLYFAMNKGLGLAKGKFVLFLNAGDLLDNKEVIAHLSKFSDDADVIYGETNLINVAGEILGTRSNLTTRKLPNNLDWKSLQEGMLVSHQSILVSMRIAPQYDTQYRCSADINWVIVALKKASRVAFCGKVISKYLVGGYSSVNTQKAVYERFKIFIKHYGLINSIVAYIFIAFRSLIFKLRGFKNY